MYVFFFKFYMMNTVTLTSFNKIYKIFLKMKNTNSEMHSKIQVLIPKLYTTHIFSNITNVTTFNEIVKFSSLCLADFNLKH